MYRSEFIQREEETGPSELTRSDSVTEINDAQNLIQIYKMMYKL